MFRSDRELLASIQSDYEVTLGTFNGYKDVLLVTDPIDGQVKSVIRKAKWETFTKGLSELKQLSQSGVEIVPYTPLVIEDRPFLVARFIEGGNAGDFCNLACLTEKQRQAGLKTAVGLADYFTDASIEGRRHLWDVENIRQYLLTDKGPVLVDIDLNLIDKVEGRDEALVLSSMLSGVFTDFRGFLDRADTRELSEHLAWSQIRQEKATGVRSRRAFSALNRALILEDLQVPAARPVGALAVQSA